MSDNWHTPSTEEIKASATRLGGWHPTAFDRWLAAHDAAVKAEAVAEVGAHVEDLAQDSYRHRARALRAEAALLDARSFWGAEGGGPARIPAQSETGALPRCPHEECEADYHHWHYKSDGMPSSCFDLYLHMREEFDTHQETDDCTRCYGPRVVR